MRETIAYGLAASGGAKGAVAFGLSAGTGLVCLIAAALQWFVNDRKTPRLVALLVMVGVACLTTTWAGETAGGLVGKATGLMDSFTVDRFDATVSGFAAAVLLFVLGVCFRKKRIEPWTLVVAALIPLALRSAGGDLGDGAVTVVKTIVQVVGGIVGTVAGTEK
ncbi:hypothetical protein AB0B10_25905 [Micromonospora arborensis]|uniref:hypothetical protein n=1 Tax=Micromonospora arborensis TaxID=2116518 RepID=UPI0033F3261C